MVERKLPAERNALLAPANTPACKHPHISLGGEQIAIENNALFRVSFVAELM